LYLYLYYHGLAEITTGYDRKLVAHAAQEWVKDRVGDRDRVRFSVRATEYGRSATHFGYPQMQTANGSD